MSLKAVFVTIGKPVRTGDGSGGKSKVFTPLAGRWKATRNFYGRTSQLIRLEQAAHNTQGAGLETRKLQLFVFRAPLPPDIQINYQIVADDGLKYIVQFVRRYDLTLQVDAEVVG